MAPLDAEDAAQARTSLNSLTEPDPDTGAPPTLTEERWLRVAEHLAALSNSWQHADAAGFRRSLGRLEAMSIRVMEVPDPAAMPAPPEVVEERNTLVTSLDLIPHPAREDGNDDASRPANH